MAGDFVPLAIMVAGTLPADVCGRCWLTSHSAAACVRKPGFALIVVLFGLLIVGAFLLFDRRLENIAE
jgi:Family of unknown function